MSHSPTKVYKGGCHCGRVAFEVRAPEPLRIIRCNCSICRMSGFEHLLVYGEDFSLLKGSEHLVSYRFHTETADHLFCGVCGVKSFYVPRSNPAGFSVNARCLQSEEPLSMEIEEFDGQRWEESIGALRQSLQESTVETE